MARGEREAGWEEVEEGAVQGTGGFKLSRQQPRCWRDGCGRGRGRGDSEREPYPLYVPQTYTPHKYASPLDIYIL